MSKLRGIFMLFALVAISLTACKKDSASPIIEEFAVNSVVTTAVVGNHDLEDAVSFRLLVTDESALGKYEVIEAGAENPIVASNSLEGTSATINYNHFITSTNDKYVVGDSIKLTFIVEDDFGNIDEVNYRINVQ